ncbi:MAG TPA: alginate lyase family protein [Candidatus Udaeobacter sp.]|jgi:hypothetical protein|nr:alginate lyase family protein [Candidatus Udaeobacter sp.]
MTDRSWKLARLAVMTPGEIAHRARVAARDRIARPRYTRQTPHQAFASLFDAGAEDVLRTSRLAALVHRIDPAQCAAEIAAAEALMEGRWTLFGHPVRLDDPPRWSANPMTGAAWPETSSADIDHRDTSHAGDPKLAWELGRLTVLPTLALASRATGDRRFADRAIRWLDDFGARHPLGRGIHHASGIEQAVRVISVTWALALLGERAREVQLEPCLGLIAQQALYCRDHLSLGSSANNHLIAEYACIAVAAAVFPKLRHSSRLLARAAHGLERETLRQFDADGVNLEQSFGYLPFIWELLLEASVSAEAAGAAASPRMRRRLRDSLEFARWIRLPNGSWPRIGDEDDGRILFAGEHGSRLDLIGNALAAWLGTDALSSRDTGLALMLRGDAAPPCRDRAGRHATSGYTIWREGDLIVTFDHGPLGLPPLGAHGHADALSITIHRGVDPVVVDPGTFAYHADRAARDRCRSTPMHATLHFGGRSQARPAGPFLWRKWPKIVPGGAAAEEGHGWICEWASGEAHERNVHVTGGEIMLEDRVIRGEGATLVFPLAPAAVIERDAREARVRIGSTLASFESEDVEPWAIESGEIAPRFGRIEPAPRLTAKLRGAVARTIIRVSTA